VEPDVRERNSQLVANRCHTPTSSSWKRNSGSEVEPPRLNISGKDPTGYHDVQGFAVKMLRFSIAKFMLVVTIVALDCIAVRAIPQAVTVFDIFWGFGVLPMANILAIVILIAKRRRRSQPFLWGFETFGLVAVSLCFLLFCVLWICSCQDEIGFFIIVRLLGPWLLAMSVDPNRETYGPILFASFAVFITVPQLVFGLIGGLLSRKFKIVRRVRAEGEQP
jgi:hypothetical protein